MPATPLTTECRAIAERMRVFPNCEGNVRYLQKLIYEDSATVMQLRAEIDAIDPPVDQSIIDGMHLVAATCGNAGEYGGNVAMWPIVQVAADALDAACDAVEAANVEEGAERKTGQPEGRPVDAMSTDGRLG